MDYKGRMQFQVKNDWNDMEAIIEIDFSHEGIMEKIKNMVEFWSGWEYHVSTNNGDYVQAFLKTLAADIQDVALGMNYNTQGVRSAYDDREGWCKMDGTDGIDILQHSTIEWDADDFEVEQTSGFKRFEVDLFA